MSLRVKLSGDELEVIGRCDLLSSIKLGTTSGLALKETGAVLDLTADEIDDLRDACIERQQVSGFDKDYELTALGRVLQGIVDKLDS